MGWGTRLRRRRTSRSSRDPAEPAAPRDRTGSVGVVTVMRRQTWNDMDAAARASLMRRGLDDIFDPTLRRSIGTLYELYE